MDANKTEILSEIMRFCKSNNMTSYYELQAYVYDHDKDDWLDIMNNRSSRTPLRHYLQSLHRMSKKPYKLTMCEAMEDVDAAKERYQKRHAECGKDGHCFWMDESRNNDQLEVRLPMWDHLILCFWNVRVQKQISRRRYAQKGYNHEKNNKVPVLWEF